VNQVITATTAASCMGPIGQEDARRLLVVTNTVNSEADAEHEITLLLLLLTWFDSSSSDSNMQCR
jgi:hypothetical protein